MTSKAYFSILRKMFLGLLIGQAMFAGISIYLNEVQEGMDGAEFPEIMIFIVPAVMVGGFLLSTMITKRKIGQINPTSDLSTKLNQYRTIAIIKWALLEGPILLAIVCYLNTADWVYIGLAGTGILYFASLYPTPLKVAREMNLPTDEGRLLQNPDNKIE